MDRKKESPKTCFTLNRNSSAQTFVDTWFLVMYSLNGNKTENNDKKRIKTHIKML